MIPRMPRWQSYVAPTTQPIFTPEQSKKLIDAAKRAGADCIKFQTYKSKKLTTQKT